MYCVKQKYFADTVQYQIFEKQGRREDVDDLQHSYLIDAGKSIKKKPRKFVFDDGTEEYLTKMREDAEEAQSESLRISRSRTIKKIYDIGRSNYWDWFLTFTFSPAMVNRYDYVECSQKMSFWLKNMRKNNPDMKYLVVPEQHKDGAWHFHGLFANVNSAEFLSSGKYTDKGQEIFNVGKYKLGFTEAIKLDGSFAVVSYLCKYITKKLCEQTKGKKRYWFSRNCDLPIVEEYELNLSYEDIIEQLDLGDARIITKDGYVNVTYIDKNLF